MSLPTELNLILAKFYKDAAPTVLEVLVFSI